MKSGLESADNVLAATHISNDYYSFLNQLGTQESDNEMVLIMIDFSDKISDRGIYNLLSCAANINGCWNDRGTFRTTKWSTCQ